MRLKARRRTTFKSKSGYRHGRGVVSARRAIKSGAKGKKW